jgi:hypothetical protein
VKTTRYRTDTAIRRPGALSFKGTTGIPLDADEYVLGISGRFGDHIDSLRIYTNNEGLRYRRKHLPDGFRDAYPRTAQNGSIDG